MSNVPFSVIDAATGLVLRSGSCPFDDLASQSTALNEVVLDPHSEDDYFDGEWLPRPKVASETAYTIAADDVDTIAFAEVPAGTLVNIRRQGGNGWEWQDQFVVDDGSLEWSTAHPGRYQLRIFPADPLWLHQDIWVTADA